MTDVHQRTPNAPAYDIAAKILLIGEAGVGKTHLILRYVDNIFEPQLVKCTVQPDVKSKDLNVHDKKVRLRIWDTAGSERFRAINRSFFRNALGVIVVYDVTDRTTFTKVKSWLEEVEINCDKQPVTILVGNKTDLSDQRQGNFIKNMTESWPQSSTDGSKGKISFENPWERRERAGTR